MLKHLSALAAAALLLGACTQQSATALSAANEYNEGIAKSCTATPIDLTSSNTASATITMTNDGWCAARTTEKDGKPFALGLLKSRPAHGTVLIRQLGGVTRMEYTADARYVGADRFTVALRSRTANVPDATVNVTVDVRMGENVAPAPTPAPAADTKPATTRRSSTRR